jgi:Ca2+-binding RTX toxin-like protein
MVSNNTFEHLVPTLVQTVQTSQFSPASPDPDGIVYISHTNTLLISDSEVEEMPSLFTGKNLFNISLSGTLQSTLKTIGFSNEPAGISYNPANKHLFFADDDHLKILDLNPGADEQYNTLDDTVASFSVTPFGGVDPEDVSFSSTTGNLFIIDGINAEVYQVTTSGSLVSQFDTQVFGIIDPEGIAVGDNGNLFIVGNPHTSTNAVGEFTSSGSLVRTIDISAANPYKPAGIAFAPSSLNSAERSLYIVDRGVDNNDDPNENDGRMYEFSLGASTATPGVPSFSAPTFSLNEDGDDEINGNQGDDILMGDAADDKLYGGKGNDKLYGGEGNDTLHGDEGADTILGNSGNDTLIGSSGNDILMGGAGNDRFVYSIEAAFVLSDIGVDTIQGFHSGKDRIVLDQTTFVDVTSKAQKGFSKNHEFAIVRSDRAAAQNKAVIVYNENNGSLFYNPNKGQIGLGEGGLFAVLTGKPAIAASDFVIQA